MSIIPDGTVIEARAQSFYARPAPHRSQAWKGIKTISFAHMNYSKFSSCCSVAECTLTLFISVSAFATNKVKKVAQYIIFMFFFSFGFEPVF